MQTFLGLLVIAFWVSLLMGFFFWYRSQFSYQRQTSHGWEDDYPRYRDAGYKTNKSDYKSSIYFNATQESISDLMNLLNGHEPTAQRLIQMYRERNPGCSDQWVIDKAIYDLERDRY